MANFVSFNPRAPKNYSESPFLGQQIQPQPQGYDSRSNNPYNAKPYLNLTPTSPLLINLSQNKYRSPKEHEDQLRFKEKSLLGNSYVHDSSFKQVPNLKHHEDEHYKNNGYSAALRPKPEVKSFLSQLSHITSSPNSIDWSKKQENNNNSNTNKPQAGMSRLWRDPAEDKAQKNKKLDEWKQMLASQVQARQMQKQKDIDYQRSQDIRDEERYKKHLEEQANSPPPPYYAERHFNKDQNMLGGSNSHQRQMSLSPTPNIPASYSQTPKNNIQFDVFSPQRKARDVSPNKERLNNHSYKSQLGNGNSLPTLALNSYIDQLKTEIFQSQKVFMEQMKRLNEDIDKRHVRTVTEKHLLLPTKDYSMRFEADPIDILDNYVHTHNPNQNYYSYNRNRDQNSNNYNNNQSPNKALRERAESSKGHPYRSQLIQQIQSFNHQLKSMAMEEDQGFNLDLATSPGGVVVAVKNKFVGVDENIVLERESLPNNPGYRTQDDFKKAQRQSIDGFKSEKVLPSDSDERDSPLASKQASIDIEAKENAEKREKNQRKGNKGGNENENKDDRENKENKESKRSKRSKRSQENKEDPPSQMVDLEEIEEDIAAASERIEKEAEARRESEKLDKLETVSVTNEHLVRDEKEIRFNVMPQQINFLEKLEMELEEIDKPREEEKQPVEEKKPEAKKGDETAKSKGEKSKEEKNEKNVKRIWLETIEPDNENMFDYMSSVFVDTKDVDTMEDLKDYKRANKTSKVKNDNKPIMETNQPTEYVKRKNIGSVEIVEEEPAPPTDLVNKEEREQYKRREIKRGTTTVSQEPAQKSSLKDQKKSGSMKKRI